ncbi:MAG: GNAT family N-acetyltransferase [bacterium]
MRPLTLTQEELGALTQEVFERAGTIHIEARGASMRPLIRSGDLLTLEPVDGRALHVGEVGLYRTPAMKLVVHRLVRKTVASANTILYFRGDAGYGGLETVAPSWVLGRVTTIERDGRAIALQSDRSRLAVSLWRVVAPVGTRAIQLGDTLRDRAARAAREVQGTPTYRRLGRRVAAGRVCYRVGTAEDAGRWERFHRVRGVGAASQLTRGPDSAFWTSEHSFTVLATVAGRLLGVTDVVHPHQRSELFPDWWFFGTQVDPLFRGLGIGEGVLMESLRQLRRRGVERCYLQVFSDNRRAQEFYGKLGFTRASPSLHEAHLVAHQGSPVYRRMVILTRLTSA